MYLLPNGEGTELYYTFSIQLPEAVKRGRILSSYEYEQFIFLYTRASQHEDSKSISITHSLKNSSK